MPDEMNAKQDETRVWAYLPGFKVTREEPAGSTLNCQILSMVETEEGWRCAFGDDAGQDSDKVLKYLQQVLYSSLQTRNLVVLSGLGTSLGAGFPSMKMLWDKVERIKNGRRILKRDKVAVKVNYAPRKGEENIEELLSRCEAHLLLHDDEMVSNFLLGAKKVILEECGTSIDLSSKVKVHEEFLYKLTRRRSRDGRLKVFTTNYDLCFEEAANNLELVAIDGFSFTQKRVYSPNNFQLDVVKRSSDGDQVNYFDGVFYLYKLHGSVDWARKPDGQKGQEKIVKVEKPSPEEACLIYPARGKFQQSYTQPYLEMMSHYLAALREPNTCVLVAGFGFNDEHISAPLYSAAATSQRFNLIVVDRSIKERCEGITATGSSYWKKLKELAGSRPGNVLLINAPFEAFVKIIPDLTPLTPAEQLVKDLKSIVG